MEYRLRNSDVYLIGIPEEEHGGEWQRSSISRKKWRKRLIKAIFKKETDKVVFWMRGWTVHILEATRQCSLGMS